MTIDNELEEAAYEMETSLFDEDSHPDLLREAANHIRAQEARIAALTTQEEIRKQLESETFEEYDWFYKLKFICRVLGNDGNAPKEDWKTAYGMARSLFDSAWLVQREKTELTKDAEPLYQCMNVTDVNQLWRDISKETFDSLNKTGFQSTRILYTHPPAPKAIATEPIDLGLARAMCRSAGISLVSRDFIERFADFVMDWKKGDFTLPKYAELDMQSCFDAWQAFDPDLAAPKAITAEDVTDEMARSLYDDLSLPDWPNAKSIFAAAVNAYINGVKP